MEQLYAREVVDNGLGDLLVQRSMRDVGHCTFTGDEIVQSCTDLFAWVETGVKPAGEDLIGDISSPTLGCDLTTGAGGSGLRFELEPCPAQLTRWWEPGRVGSRSTGLRWRVPDGAPAVILEPCDGSQFSVKYSFRAKSRPGSSCPLDAEHVRSRAPV